MKGFYYLGLATFANYLSFAGANKDSIFFESGECDRCPPKSKCTVHTDKVPGSFLLDNANKSYFSCSCKDGYKSYGNNPGWNCKDINECAEDNPCPVIGGFCVDTEPDNPFFPRYKCGCLKGYVETNTNVHGATGCAALPILAPSLAPHESALPSMRLPSQAISVESVASCSDICKGRNRECVDDECVCKNGFFAFNAASTHCVDENECQDGYPNECHRHATCTNTHGSYTCACNDGWRDTGSSGKLGFDCVNIDECAEGMDDCADDHFCIDRFPPQKYECIDPTAAPTPAPMPTGRSKSRRAFFFGQFQLNCDESYYDCEFDNTSVLRYIIDILHTLSLKLDRTGEITCVPGSVNYFIDTNIVGSVSKVAFGNNRDSYPGGSRDDNFGFWAQGSFLVPKGTWTVELLSEAGGFLEISDNVAAFQNFSGANAEISYYNEYYLNEVHKSYIGYEAGGDRCESSRGTFTIDVGTEITFLAGVWQNSGDSCSEIRIALGDKLNSTDSRDFQVLQHDVFGWKSAFDPDDFDNYYY